MARCGPADDFISITGLTKGRSRRERLSFVIQIRESEVRYIISTLHEYAEIVGALDCAGDGGSGVLSEERFGYIMELTVPRRGLFIYECIEIFVAREALHRVS